MLQIPSLGLFIKFAVAIVFILLPYKHYTALFFTAQRYTSPVYSGNPVFSSVCLSTVRHKPVKTKSYTYHRANNVTSTKYAVHWLHNFLMPNVFVVFQWGHSQRESHRSFRVQCDKNLSSFHTSSCGVPKVSVLGPLLFDECDTSGLWRPRDVIWSEEVRCSSKMKPSFRAFAHRTQKPTCQNTQLFTWHLPLVGFLKPNPVDLWVLLVLGFVEFLCGI